ncbi:hypothetical protein VCRA2121O157_50240 [Vibrio crassostreae]|nr:hypothetical protein VCRA2118O144_100076 [Vibrio crassostreae]CAK2083888.1 hypothetical protein VCRA2113O213_30166 [Vibrio crassostreae]CAK2114293.1 hypothetical protein VCRA2113O137_40079 [Vibrio crassostreae]CAK2161206.1 hypothetical protein VCRA2113O322_60013 [Vibrio crassostreae]CAK2351844.1 hypothetical protein VCRA2116O141_50079 [Vibrio crassostreae]
MFNAFSLRTSKPYLILNSALHIALDQNKSDYQLYYLLVSYTMRSLNFLYY